MDPRYAWIDTLEVGDVIRSRAGTYRIVRAIRKFKGRVYSVSLTIRHCSWTKRCHTSMNRYDLVWNGYSKMQGVKAKMNTELDQRINREINNHTHTHTLTCCDVVGVA